MSLKGLRKLGIWTALPLLGGLFWLGSGWFSDRQLRQSKPSVESIQLKLPKLDR
jgi:hypothetical protein